MDIEKKILSDSKITNTNITSTSPIKPEKEEILKKRNSNNNIQVYEEKKINNESEELAIKSESIKLLSRVNDDKSDDKSDDINTHKHQISNSSTKEKSNGLTINNNETVLNKNLNKKKFSTSSSIVEEEKKEESKIDDISEYIDNYVAAAKVVK